MQDDNFKPARELGNGVMDLPGTGVFPTAAPQVPIVAVAETTLATSHLSGAVAPVYAAMEWGQPENIYRLAQFPDGRVSLQQRWKYGRGDMLRYDWKTQPTVRVDANGVEIPGQPQ